MMCIKENLFCAMYNLIPRKYTQKQYNTGIGIIGLGLLGKSHWHQRRGYGHIRIKTF